MSALAWITETSRCAALTSRTHWRPRWRARPLVRAFATPGPSKHRLAGICRLARGGDRRTGTAFCSWGDAAGLIDPFTGEGIGNALYSARFAVETAVQAREAGDYSAGFLRCYEDRLWDALGSELKLSTKLHNLGRWPYLMNLVIRKAAKKCRGQRPDLRHDGRRRAAQDADESAVLSPAAVEVGAVTSGRSLRLRLCIKGRTFVSHK